MARHHASRETPEELTGARHPRDEAERTDQVLLRRLVRAMEAGDSAEINRAFEDIYNRYVRLVAFVCARYLRDDGDIQSETNLVFVQFFNHADRIDGGGSLRAYLTTAARHQAISHLRAEARRNAHLCDLSDGPPGDSQPYEDAGEDRLARLPDPDEADPGASLRYRALIDDMRSVMDGKALHIVLAHAVYGETFPAIAERLRMKPATVKTVYHRALEAFRQKKGETWL